MVAYTRLRLEQTTIFNCLGAEQWVWETEINNLLLLNARSYWLDPRLELGVPIKSLRLPLAGCTLDATTRSCPALFGGNPGAKECRADKVAIYSSARLPKNVIPPGAIGTPFMKYAFLSLTISHTVIQPSRLQTRDKNRSRRLITVVNTRLDESYSDPSHGLGSLGYDINVNSVKVPWRMRPGKAGSYARGIFWPHPF